MEMGGEREGESKGGKEDDEGEQVCPDSMYREVPGAICYRLTGGNDLGNMDESLTLPSRFPVVEGPEDFPCKLISEVLAVLSSQITLSCVKLGNKPTNQGTFQKPCGPIPLLFVFVRLSDTLSSHSQVTRRLEEDKKLTSILENPTLTQQDVSKVTQDARATSKCVPVV
ncbi:hypothetical protein STEG23_032050 [Scotinomys teguina]